MRWPIERCDAEMRGMDWRGPKGPRERCARAPGHTTPHRTAFSVANTNHMNTGRDYDMATGRIKE